MTTEHRLRFNDDEIRFILMILEEMRENTEFTRDMSSSRKREHRNDTVRTEYNRMNSIHSEMVRKLYGIKELTHRFQATLEGGRPRTNKWAKLAMRMLLAEAKSK